MTVVDEVALHRICHQLGALQTQASVAASVAALSPEVRTTLAGIAEAARMLRGGVVLEILRLRGIVTDHDAVSCDPTGYDDAQ